MSKPKYELVIYWSREDEAFIAEAPELAGCAADGKTYQEALANVGRPSVGASLSVVPLDKGDLDARHPWRICLW